MPRSNAPARNACFFDITDKPVEFLRERFPNIYETCLRFGIDMTKQPIPVVPAAHYQCGGIKTDVNGATSLPGSVRDWRSGLHRIAWRESPGEQFAARRFGCRAPRSRVRGHALHPNKVSGDFAVPEWQSGDVQDVDELVVIYHNWDEIRRLMWDYVGIVRTDKRLATGQRPFAQSPARDPRVLLELQESRSICWSCATWLRWRR